MQDHEEHNSWLEEQAARGAADRAAMVDRIVGSDRTGARDLLRAEVEGDWARLQPYAVRDRVGTEAIDRAELEVYTLAKWGGIDKGLVDITRSVAANARLELPAGTLEARDVLDVYAEKSVDRTPEGSLAVDHPASPVNQRLNAALAEDLRGRVSVSFTRGYSARLESGLEWLQSDTEGRTVMEANTLASRVEAYGTLDRINDEVAAEIDIDDQLRDPDTFARQLVSASMDHNLVEAAYIAGRWSGTDPVIDNQLDVLTSRTAGIDAAPQVTDQDMREVRFHFADPTLHGGEAGLVGMARSQAERAAAALLPAANAAADGLNAVRNVLQTQRGIGRAADGAVERRYEPPAAGPSTSLER